LSDALKAVDNAARMRRRNEAKLTPPHLPIALKAVDNAARAHSGRGHSTTLKGN
jgi:hypothetical protein